MYTLGGPFTVDSYGKKVIFSKGNLQYNANSTNAGTAPYTPAWRFAPNSRVIIKAIGYMEIRAIKS